MPDPSRKFLNDGLVGGGECELLQFVGPDPFPCLDFNGLRPARLISATIGVERNFKMAVSVVHFD